jgi:uncharacterized DUF497 family protein
MTAPSDEPGCTEDKAGLEGGDNFLFGRCVLDFPPGYLRSRSLSYIHLISMAITFDPAKRAWTLRERGLDFERAAEVFAGPTIVLDEAGDDRHIISMRKANAKEQARYSKAVAAAYGERTEKD